MTEENVEELKLGDVVKHTLTWFEGKLVGIANYLERETDYLVQPQKTKDDGSYMTWTRFERQQIEKIK